MTLQGSFHLWLCVTTLLCCRASARGLPSQPGCRSWLCAASQALCFLWGVCAAFSVPLSSTWEGATAPGGRCGTAAPPVAHKQRGEVVLHVVGHNCTLEKCQPGGCRLRGGCEVFFPCTLLQPCCDHCIKLVSGQCDPKSQACGWWHFHPSGQRQQFPAAFAVGFYGTPGTGRKRSGKTSLVSLGFPSLL